jgi:hypothetical protein
VLAEGQPRGQVLAAVWVRAAEGLDESAFAAFRRAALGANEHVVAGIDGDRVDVSVPGLAAPLQLRADLRRGQRLATEGADPALQTGILNVNGRNLGAALSLEPHLSPEDPAHRCSRLNIAAHSLSRVDRIDSALGLAPR